MTKRAPIILGAMAAATALTTAAPGAGAATTPIYSGGGFAYEKAYRDLFNAYGNNAKGDLCIGRPACPTPYNDAVEILFAGVGAGNGTKAIDANDSSLFISSSKKPDAVPVASTRDFGPFYGTGTGSDWVPASSGPFYPKLNFIVTDSPLNQTDIDTAKASNLGNNPLVQFPSLVSYVPVPFNPAPNWTPKGATLAGASSKVQLSTNTLCGIFTGTITTWDHPSITKDNAGVRLGTGKITVVYRHDSAGQTFLFSNALLNQCGNTAATGITAVTTKSTNPIPGQWLIDNSITKYSDSAPHYKTGTSFFINVFNAGHLPANFYNDVGAAGVEGGATGTNGTTAAILATPGAIGYNSADFTRPVDATGPAAANLQTYASFNAGTTPVYKAPTFANALPIVAASKPPAFPTAAANPLNWGVINPLPAPANAYPIGGFTFVDAHRCFASAADVAALAATTGKYGLFTWYFGAKSINGGNPQAILAHNGYGPVPNIWAAAITRLLTAPATGLNVPGTGACKTVKKGA